MTTPERSCACGRPERCSCERKHPERHGGRDRHAGCSCCGTGILEDVTCSDRGVQAESEYSAAAQPVLARAGKAFATARSDYAEARSQVVGTVASCRGRIRDLVETFRCELDASEVEGIDRAFARVVERLERCGDDLPDCGDDCDDEDDRKGDGADDGGGAADDEDDEDACSDESLAELDGRITTLERRWKDCTELFTRLVQEYTDYPPADPAATVAAGADATVAVSDTPVAAGGAAAGAGAAAAVEVSAVEGGTGTVVETAAQGALKRRVDALDAEVQKIVDDETAAPTERYARTLVARRHLDRVWLGFDSVREYFDCLCGAYTCMARCYHALKPMKRRQAVLRCYREQCLQTCERFATHTWEEVRDEYRRMCAEDEDCDRGESRDCDDDRDRDDRGRDGRGDRDRDDRDDRDRDDRDRRRDDRDRGDHRGRGRDRDDRDRDDRDDRDRDDRDRDDRDRDRDDRGRDGRGDRDRDDRDRDDRDRDDDRSERRPRGRDERGRYRSQ